MRIHVAQDRHIMASAAESGCPQEGHDVAVFTPHESSSIGRLVKKPKRDR
jgi:hypothetical protein